MKIFIIGASGLVGSNCMQCMQDNPDFDVVGSHYLFATNNTEYFDVFNPKLTTFDLAEFNPDVIVHTGALTHVDYCETHQDESYKHTVESTQKAIELANRLNAKFVYISSDYIFDGENGPYAEYDDTNPLSVYGKHKFIAEKLVKESCEDYLILRITNVYGNEIRGKNFIAFLKKTAQSGEEKHLRLPVDQYATPINAADIGRILCRLLMDGKQGIYHLASDEYINRVELAEKVLAHFPDHKISIEALSTAELDQAAPRPLKGGLKTDKIKNEYPKLKFTTVEDYLEERYGI
ncbi:MAG: NAD(P)-dependent oxidoreductase [Candidatus Marinimicrobia bacterium]|nr:NAD(P)-dependent oxidoreductase [Candidatus Neomarinimicrobiota bacterium]